MSATKINLTGIQELDITGITSPSTAAGVTSFTIPSASPGGVTGAIQYNNSGAFGGFADGTAHQVLHGGKTFAAVDLTADVSGILPPTNGGVASVTAAPGYYIPLPLGGSPALTFSTNQSVNPVANRQYAIVVVIPHILKVSSFTIATGSSAATGGVMDFGFFDSSGNLLVNTAGQTMSATSTVYNIPATSPVTLQPGTYYFAWTGSILGNALNCFNTIANGNILANGSPGSVFGSTASVSGILQATLGSLSSSPLSTSPCPLCKVAP